MLKGKGMVLHIAPLTGAQ